MSRQLARRVEDRIHLDTLVRVRVFSGTVNDAGYYSTETADEEVWAAVEQGRSEWNVASDNTTLVRPLAFTVRYDSRWASLVGARIEVRYEDDEWNPVTKITRIGRRRFLRLEVES